MKNVNRVYDIDTKTINNEKQGLFVRFLYKTILGRIVLKLLISKPVSKLFGWLLRTRLSKLFISSFIKKNHINMSDYEEKEFISFDNFFIRKIKDGAREVGIGLVSPADSKLSVYKISSDLSFKIKNSVYSVSSILQDEDLALEYSDGYVCVFRLCVDDYHRYSFIDDGCLISSKTINGFLHTVNPLANENFKIYSENHRVVSVLDTDNYGKMIQIEVGALNVGKINNHVVDKFSRMQEKGYFSFGASTVILIFKKDVVDINSIFIDNTLNDIETRVLLGQQIGEKKKIN